MKKKLDTASITNELEESSFFKDLPKLSSEKIDETSKAKIEAKSTPPPSSLKLERKPVKKEVKTTSNTVISRHYDTMVSSNQDIITEIIRKAVKHLGKEAATYRFTQEEKKALADIVYTYKGQGIRTSENEITRIAINYLVENYKQDGENSILARVIKRLNE
jgi:C-terminal processing protease CtpA/Prc